MTGRVCDGRDPVLMSGVVPVPSAQPGAHALVPPARRWKIILPALVVIAMIIGGALYLRSRNAHVLTEKDTIVLADFANATGDAVFDDTLKQALSVDLQQSPFLNVLSEEKVQDTLRLMGRVAGERLTAQAAVGRLTTTSLCSLGGPGSQCPF